MFGHSCASVSYKPYDLTRLCVLAGLCVLVFASSKKAKLFGKHFYFFGSSQPAHPFLRGSEITQFSRREISKQDLKLCEQAVLSTERGYDRPVLRYMVRLCAVYVFTYINFERVYGA